MGGGTLGANTQTISKAKYKADERARQYKREKIDPQSEAAQRNIGDVSSDMYASADMAAKGTMDWYDKNTMSLRPSSTDDDSSNDTAEANYTTSGRTQTSSGKGKGANLKEKDKKKVKGASKQLTAKQKA